MENPKIRFKGFTKDWEQRKLNEVGVVIDPHPSHRAPKEEQGGIPFIGIGDVDEMGNINRESARPVPENVYDEHHKRYDLNVPSLGLGRVASLGKVIRLRSDIGKYAISPTISVLQFSENINIDYLYAYMNTPQFKKQFEGKSNGSTRQSVGTEMVRLLNLSMPFNLDEQKAIGTFYKNLDNLITLHQRKCEQTKKLKKYMLQKMFPQNGAKVPEIRFYGFTYDWEQRKFSELVTIERGGSPRPIDKFITNDENGLNWVKIGDAPEQGNYITQTAEKIRPEGLSKTREVHPGDLILSNSMSFGRPYIMAIDGCIHDGWLAIRDTKKNFDLKFLCTLLGTDGMLNQYKAMAAGSTVNNLNKELVGGTTVTFPMVEEQIKIGDYFTTLDHLITLHQRKCDELKKMKKYMLQNMFI